MAQQAKTKRFLLSLSNVDAGVYGEFDVRLAQQPAETDAFMLTRLIGYAFLLRDDVHSTLQFSKAGLANPDEPALSRVSLDGRVLVWCEFGNPSAERLHRASKSAAHVVLFTHHPPARLAEELGRATIHRKQELEVWAIAPEFLAELGGHLGERGAELSLTIAEQVLYLTIAGATLSAPLRPVTAV
jgi:uncharacterized protein YaeQ